MHKSAWIAASFLHNRRACGLALFLVAGAMLSGCEKFQLPGQTTQTPTSDVAPRDDSPDEIEVAVTTDEEPDEDAKKHSGQEAGVPGFNFGAIEPPHEASDGNSSLSFKRAGKVPAPENSYSRADSVDARLDDDAPTFEYEPDEFPVEAARPARTAGIPGAKKSASGVTTIRVFYGTDRRATGSKTPNEFFGPERGKLSVGFCDVSLPPNHQPGELESPSIWRFEFRENPERHVMLRTVEPVRATEFFAELRQTVNESKVDAAGQQSGGEVFIFVHGFNVSFKDAARRTAQIAYDLSFPGAPVMFSWPSHGRTSLRFYRDDARSAEWCQEHVMDFVTAIAKHSQARRVHLIAHSMGNRVVAGALRRLAYNKATAPHFNQVILTAPDIDAETFKVSIAPRITSIAERFTIYASSDDLALRTAARINSWGDPRLGQAGDDLMTFPNFPTIDVVDASDVDTSLFSTNHSYFAESQSVLADLKRTLRGLNPDKRGLQTVIRKVAWRIPEELQKIAIDDPDERFE